VPHKHSVPHAVARFSASGQLVLVSHGAAGAKAPRAGAGSVGSVELRSVRRLVRPGALAACDALLEAVDAFPGPLCVATSDQTTLVEFCRRKALRCRADGSLFDQQSAALLWHTVATLIRQNGVRLQLAFGRRWAAITESSSAHNWPRSGALAPRRLSLRGRRRGG